MACLDQVATVGRLPTTGLSRPTGIPVPTQPNLFPHLFDRATRFELEAYILLAVLPEQLDRLKTWHVRGSPYQLPPLPLHVPLHLFK